MANRDCFIARLAILAAILPFSRPSPPGMEDCDAEKRVQLAEEFQKCSQGILSDHFAVWRATAVDKRQKWPDLLCQLIGTQIDECGDQIWPKCYSSAQILALKKMQLHEQVQIVHRSMDLKGDEADKFDWNCPILAKRGGQLQKDLLSQTKEFCNHTKSPVKTTEFLNCAMEVENAIGHLIFEEKSLAHLSDLEKPVCEAYRHSLSPHCHTLLTTCLSEEFLRNVNLGQMSLYKRMVVQKTKVSQEKLELELKLLGICVRDGRNGRGNHATSLL